MLLSSSFLFIYFSILVTHSLLPKAEIDCIVTVYYFVTFCDSRVLNQVLYERIVSKVIFSFIFADTIEMCPSINE